MFFWILMLLLLLWVVSVPARPYHRRYAYGYYPFGAISAVLIVFLVLWWVGAFTVVI